MANYQDFITEYDDEVWRGIGEGNLKNVLELWLDFTARIAERADSKLRDLDDIFDY